MSTNRPKTIIVFLPQEWTDYVRRPHWEAISRLAPVHAIEPPTGLLTFWRHLERLLPSSQAGLPPGLRLARPWSLVSTGLALRVPFLAAIDRWWIRRQLKKGLKRSGLKAEDTVWFVVKAHQSYLSGLIPGALQVYEITDEYRVGTGDTRYDPGTHRAKVIGRAEDRILADSDLVLVCSEALRESRSRLHANVHYLPNCADFEFFAAAAEDRTVVPEELAAIDSPRLGYLGGFNDLIDLELLVALAEARPEAALVIVGEERGSAPFRDSELYGRFKALPNVRFLGHRPYAQLPGYIKGFDVCLLPFAHNEWMRNSSPNKTFQYLAAGRPVVATDFPEARRVDSVVAVAKTHAEFIELVDRALQPTDESVIARRRETARENSTENRAEKLLRLVDEAGRVRRGDAG